MLLEKILEDNIVLVIPSQIKDIVLSKLNSLDKIYNIKIISKEI